MALARDTERGELAAQGFTRQGTRVVQSSWKPVYAAARRSSITVFPNAASLFSDARLRVATKYVRTTREHFAAKGMHVDLIRLYGSMELAPLTGLADAIVDLVSSGRTLRDNDLVEVEEILPISARLIVNQAALKTKRSALQPLIDAFARAAQ